MGDPFNLARFVEAQRGSYERALAELRAGRKTSHWMWYIFPQIAGLGFSAMSQLYAISSLEEARAYLDHPELGPRLVTCTKAVNGVSGRTAHDIFGATDEMKFHSSMTLFAEAAPERAEFREALQKYFDSAADPRTLEILGRR